MTAPGFGRAAHDYARHRGGFPPEFFDSLTEIDIDVRGARIVDLGTGAGALARGFARRGAEVIALDISEDLMREARRLDRESGVGVEYVTAPAEDTGSPSETVVLCPLSRWERVGAREKILEVQRPGRPNCSPKNSTAPEK